MRRLSGRRIVDVGLLLVTAMLVAVCAATTHGARRMVTFVPDGASRPLMAHAAQQQASLAARAEEQARSRAAAAVARSPRRWGVTVPDLPGNTAGLTSLSQATGHRPGVVMWYVAWSLHSAFPAADATRVRTWGATPEITWEPWDPAAGLTQPGYALARIAHGDFDRYLVSWARAVTAWNSPIRLRFAQEMNGNWYPWAEGVNGNRAGSFVAAWRHIHQVFTSVGATKVTWVWSPNVPFTGSTSLPAVFPGDRYVDEVALDGYNWSNLMPGSAWTSFAGVFGPGVAELSRLSTRPLGIGEVGCPEVGGSKAAWIAAMWKTLAAWPRVRTLMWFSFDKEADWRIDSTPAALHAFGRGTNAFVAS